MQSVYTRIVYTRVEKGCVVYLRANNIEEKGCYLKILKAGEARVGRRLGGQRSDVQSHRCAYGWRYTRGSAACEAYNISLICSWIIAPASVSLAESSIRAAPLAERTRAAAERAE